MVMFPAFFADHDLTGTEGVLTGPPGGMGPSADASFQAGTAAQDSSSTATGSVQNAPTIRSDANAGADGATPMDDADLAYARCLELLRDRRSPARRGSRPPPAHLTLPVMMGIYTCVLNVFKSAPKDKDQEHFTIRNGLKDDGVENQTIALAIAVADHMGYEFFEMVGKKHDAYAALGTIGNALDTKAAEAPGEAEQEVARLEATQAAAR